MLADQADFVIGVDTHEEAHTLALVETATLRTRASVAVEANRDGYRRALRLARLHAPGRRVWALEGSGCYGAGLTRVLQAAGERVLEIERPQRSGRSGRAKSDLLDAERAARALLAGERGAEPRTGGEREALRLLLISREQAVNVRRDGLNQLRALLVTAPDDVRQRLRRLGRKRLLSTCAALRPDRRAAAERYACQLALRGCAQRIKHATREAAALERELGRIVDSLAPTLQSQPGIGPISAAQLLVSWSHPGRLRSEAAFARLAGTAPIPASSGKTSRHRLDRGGDRRLNRALHTIILTRRRSHPATNAYLTRRQAEGKTNREAIRCLKRYLARSLYRQLETTP
jgi:transposase